MHDLNSSDTGTTVISIGKREFWSTQNPAMSLLHLISYWISDLCWVSSPLRWPLLGRLVSVQAKLDAAATPDNGVSTLGRMFAIKIRLLSLVCIDENVPQARDPLIGFRVWHLDRVGFEDNASKWLDKNIIFRHIFIHVCRLDRIPDAANVPKSSRSWHCYSRTEKSNLIVLSCRTDRTSWNIQQWGRSPDDLLYDLDQWTASTRKHLSKR